MYTCGRELLIAVLLGATVVVPAMGGEQRGKPDEDTARLVNGNNQFALEVYGKVKQNEKNEFLSPYSISTALAMTYAGAREQTADQMAKVLHFDLPPDRLHEAFRAWTDGLKSQGRDADELLVANALWGQKGFDFRSEYISLVEKDYGGKLSTLDFAKATEAARSTINKWVEEKTKGKIKDLIKQGMLEPSIRLVLTNAIYFKGAWVMPFEGAATRPEGFITSGGRKIEVPTMHASKHFGYMEEPDFQALEMPYRGGRRSMVILLPRQVDGLAGLEEKLDAGRLAGWLAKLSRKDEVQVSLPKFRVESTYNLVKPMQSLGMTDAFSPSSADFSGMDGRKDLFISFIVHKTYVDVDEKGTEAAAATGVGMALSAAPMPSQPKIFKADHPFLFLIRDTQSGGILFLGRVVNPAAVGTR